MAVYTDLDSRALRALLGAYDVGALISAKGIAEGVSNSNWLIETDGCAPDAAASAAAPDSPAARPARAPAGPTAAPASPAAPAMAPADSPSRGPRPPARPASRPGWPPAQTQRFILTMYEARTEVADLPFFLGLLDHLAARGAPVPRTIHDRSGATHRHVTGADGTAKPVALIEFLPGVSVSHPTPAAAHAVGAALAQIHHAAADFPMTRANTMALPAWQGLLADCTPAGLAAIDAGLPALVAHHLAALAADWPGGLPTGTIHADLFPDNVLMLGDTVAGLIDFYFACTDTLAYDVAVTHAAWCFSPDGASFRPDLSAALLAGYASRRPLSPAERAALPVLAQGAAMRFLATRAYDWLNTPAGALVTRKDPMAFARRLSFYADPAQAGLFA